jgi:HEAT repeat protein
MRFARQPGNGHRLVSVRVEGALRPDEEAVARVIVRPLPAARGEDQDVLQAPGVRLVRRAPGALDDPEVRDRLKDEIYDHGRQADAAAVAGLAAIMAGDYDPSLRRLAANTLATTARGPLDELGRRRATAAFVAALDDASSAVRTEALRGLRMVAGRQATRHIARAATVDPDPAIRGQAVRLLAPLGGAARRTLERALVDADADVRQAAAEALQRPSR